MVQRLLYTYNTAYVLSSYNYTISHPLLIPHLSINVHNTRDVTRCIKMNKSKPPLAVEQIHTAKPVMALLLSTAVMNIGSIDQNTNYGQAG